jgi:hypothetical protein
MHKIPVGVLGASGYAGRELCALVLRHPALELRFAAANERRGERALVAGREVAFVALPDGSLVVDEEEGDAQLDPLATAVEEQIPPPYRAHGVRKSDSVWAVSATRIDVAEFESAGGEVELTRTPEGTLLTVDGARTFGSIPALERLGEREGESYAVRATRIDGNLWEVRAAAL